MNKINLINKNNSLINILKKGTSYSKKNLKNFNHKYINFDKHGLSKTLICLSALALTSLHACNNEEIKPEENISIEDIHSKNFLLKMLDESMNTLGLIVKPSKSLTEVKTISFNSDKTKYYIQPYKITEKETIINIAKINADNTPEKKSIFIYTKGSMLQLKSVVNNEIEETRLVLENDVVKEFKKDGNIWVQTSTLKKQDSGTFIQTFFNGDTKSFTNIKNNEEMPSNVFFDVIIAPWNEIRDTINV